MNSVKARWSSLRWQTGPWYWYWHHAYADALPAINYRYYIHTAGIGPFQFTWKSKSDKW